MSSSLGDVSVQMSVQHQASISKYSTRTLYTIFGNTKTRSLQQQGTLLGHVGQLFQHTEIVHVAIRHGFDADKYTGRGFYDKRTKGKGFIDGKVSFETKETRDILIEIRVAHLVGIQPNHRVRIADNVVYGRSGKANAQAQLTRIAIVDGLDGNPSLIDFDLCTGIYGSGNGTTVGLGSLAFYDKGPIKIHFGDGRNGRPIGAGKRGARKSVAVLRGPIWENWSLSSIFYLLQTQRRVFGATRRGETSTRENERCGFAVTCRNGQKPAPVTANGKSGLSKQRVAAPGGAMENQKYHECFKEFFLVFVERLVGDEHALKCLWESMFVPPVG